KNKLQAFSHDFKNLELNRTFYKLPMVKTTKRWRKEVTKDFEFTMKAWQAITHPTSSPIWHKKKKKLTSKQKNNFGYFKPNTQVINAWKETKKRAEALKAQLIVFQTPKSFECKQKNIENIKKFFEKINHGNLSIGWEPRGNWNKNPSKIKEICNQLDLVHIVDIMRRKPLSKNSTCYIRLHGLNENEYNYNYDYSKKEIEKIAEKIKKLTKRYDQIYCMFNNYTMYQNANQLKETLF
ncbi:MAG: DUF72 domain-containing protein, partial [Candidatus Thermoplasmatota archaeon]